MMMTPDQLWKIAAAVSAVRPEWDATGIRAALQRAPDEREPWQVAAAAMLAAGEPTNRTPAVIPLAGRHWVEPLGVKSPTSARMLQALLAGEEASRYEAARNPWRSSREEKLARADEAAERVAQMGKFEEIGARCPHPGHEYYPARTCPGCRSERLVAGTEVPHEQKAPWDR